MRLLKFIRKWNELITLPLAFLLWYYSPIFLRWIDPTAGVFDAGIFQVFIYAWIGILLGNFIVWIQLRLIFPKLYSFLDDQLERIVEHKSITPWQSIIVTLWLFTLFFAGFVLLASSLM